MSVTWPSPDKRFFRILDIETLKQHSDQKKEKMAKTHHEIIKKNMNYFIYCEILVDLQIRDGAQLLIIRISCNRICRQQRIG
jgi:hypothetical protein